MHFPDCIAASDKHEKGVGQMSNYELEEDEFELDSNDVLGQLRTEDSLSSWLTEYGDVFGVSQTNQTNSAIPEGFVDSYKKAQSTVDSGISADREQMIQAQMDEASAKGPDALKQLFADLGKAGY